MAQGNKRTKPEVTRDEHGRVTSGTPNPSGVSKERAACKRLFEEDAEKYRARLNGFVEQTDDKWLAFEATKLGLAYALGKPNLVITGENGGPVQVADLSRLTVAQLEELERIRKAALGE